MKNKELKSKYKRRAKYLRRGVGTQFVRGHTGIEKRIVLILVDLINGKSILFCLLPIPEHGNRVASLFAREGWFTVRDVLTRYRELARLGTSR